MSDDDFLSRWSRRKRAPVPDSDMPVETATPDIAEEELEANRLAAEAFDLTNLTRASDLSLFLKAGVPVLLRQRALAKLWRSDTVFANLDGLLDHAEDFHDPKVVSKNYQSAWKAGRGYLKQVAEQVADATDATPEPDPDPPAAVEADQPPEPTVALDEPQPDDDFASTELDEPATVSLRSRLGLEDS